MRPRQNAAEKNAKTLRQFRSWFASMRPRQNAAEKNLKVGPTNALALLQ